MTSAPQTRPDAAPLHGPETTVTHVIFAVAFCHMLNDLMQSLIPAIYPLIKDSLALTYGQIGLITLAFQGTASILQPLVGLYTDKRPLPYALAAGMGSTLVGLILLAHAASFGMVLISVALIGLGSAIFHPESSRIARLAAGMRPGFAQSFFQVGGNIGTSLGPLAAAAIVVPRGQISVEWFAAVAMLGMLVLTYVGRWFVREGAHRALAGKSRPKLHDLAPGKVRLTLILLILLMFSKFVYSASFSSYYSFYLIEQFGLSVDQAQFCLFIYLAAVALGTFVGGPVGDRIGRKRVIWLSILGVFPFSILMPYVGLYPCIVLSALGGMIMASAFPAIIVYAQELLPQKVGMIAGLFFGLAFGMGALGAAIMGQVADARDVHFVFQISAWLPLIGLAAAFLPNLRAR
ncbi:MFS transporter [Neogemmobacter tilapiae]|uniref:MFS transporter n=1 Tax=Neogemmobacter tilapiae TaxID=875041 RepID=A0A918TK57_9RHOB|nr:MFS transporter [Gemmobacter tilapiae]GHC51495.1 MFS transporter [Gemmobacter tilapiae]